MKLHKPPRQATALLLATVALAGCDWLDGEPPAAPLMAVQVVDARRTDVPLSFEMVGSTLGNQDVPYAPVLRASLKLGISRKVLLLRRVISSTPSIRSLFRPSWLQPRVNWRQRKPCWSNHKQISDGSNRWLK